ncbi:zinc finger CCCH domain-containing protein 18-like [Canna indica]|uniref:Zinc finger CCCH domain-containing protein 18-like n=1 Tax=Canna indica TaxID=4628 RepID=A0AAQ3JMN8_9LILI|nr:zinc finger CCCH domain-containing protein 18-like [Canna indica]
MEGGETMDFFELAKVIFTRVQKLHPDINVVKIIGYIFFKEPSMQEMFQLAFGPESALMSKVFDANTMLAMMPSKSCMPDTSSHMNLHTPYLDPQIAPEQHPPSHNFDYVPPAYTGSVGGYSFLNRPQGVEQMDSSNHIGNYYFQEARMSLSGGMASSRSNRRSYSLSDLTNKPCHYFNKGYCKHGVNCRYSHAQLLPEGYSHAFGPNMTEYANDEHSFTPKSLEKLEMEITELLRSKRGMPISIASLPMLYYEKYGRHLQAEGYLSESQRHGKAGLNLTKLLSHFKKSIRLLERPHGQHSVILAEDAPRLMEFRNERSNLGTPASSSHQIYLTFPAESTFTEDDVSNYFKQFGQVRDVRIPCQERRMYGFVSFVHSETVHTILAIGNPHYICGAQVLVKQYKEKPKVNDRTNPEKVKSITHYPSQYIEMDHDVRFGRGESDNSRLHRNHIAGDKELLMGFERLRLSSLNLQTKTPSPQRFLTQGMVDLNVSEGSNEFAMGPFNFSYAFDFVNNGSASDETTRQTSNSSSSDQDG